MPNQVKNVPAPVDICPVCSHNGDGDSLYVPNGVVIKPNNGRPQALTDPLPAQNPTPETRHSEPSTQSVQFWQGLAAGLAVVIVILFFVIALLA